MPHGEKKSPFALWAGAAMLWLALCAAAVAVATLGLLSTERLPSPVEIQNAYAALLAAQVFFLVAVWPLFEVRSREQSVREALGAAFVRLLGLLMLSLPLVLLTLRTSETPAAGVAASQTLLLLFGMIAACAVRLPGAAAWYIPLAFAVSAVAPFAAYLLYEVGGVSPSWAASVSPFSAASAAADGRFVGPLIVFACAACVAVAARLLLRPHAAAAAQGDSA